MAAWPGHIQLQTVSIVQLGDLYFSLPGTFFTWLIVFSSFSINSDAICVKRPFLTTLSNVAATSPAAPQSHHTSSVDSTENIFCIFFFRCLFSIFPSTRRCAPWRPKRCLSCSQLDRSPELKVVHRTLKVINKYLLNKWLLNNAIYCTLSIRKKIYMRKVLNEKSEDWGWSRTSHYL